MGAPKRYFSKPVEVYAMQFTDWGSAGSFFTWQIDVFYIPRGYEHSMRTAGELDRSAGYVLETAPAFLILRNEDGTLERVDQGSWIVKGEDGISAVLTNEDFEANFEQAIEAVQPSGQ